MAAVSYTIPGLHVTEYEVSVPLDWFDSSATETITVFVRDLVDPARRREDLPCLLYLQGGPGGKSPRPLAADGWIGTVLKTHRLILLDQRGTGRSSPIGGAAIARFADPSAAADYLAHFRADSIVADAEHIRKTIYGGRRWATLGQSFGGFLTLTYLSQAPTGLSCCLITGGLPDIDPNAEDVYRHTYPRVEQKNEAYYARFPADRDAVARIADRVAVGDVRLPDGDRLSLRRLQSLGLDFGMGPGFERVHWLIDEAFAADGCLSEAFLFQVMTRTSFVENPLFAVLQESIYGHGRGEAANWAAERVRADFGQFDPGRRPLLFTGEMIYPWMFAEIRALRPFEPAMEILAARTDWSQLYDSRRLATNEVPVAAAVYFDDMYVDSDLQRKTAARIGNLQIWITNEYEHDGLHHERVLERLRTMIDERGGALPYNTEGDGK